MLRTMFEQLLSMSVTALPVIAVVLSVRWLLRRAPKKYTYLLWLVVAFRLVCPAAPESPVGLVQAGETTRQIAAAADTYIEPTLTYRDNGGFTPDYDVLLGRGYTPNEQGEIVTNEAGTREAWQVRDLLSLAAVIWLAGMAAMAAYLVFTTLRLRRQVATAVLREGNIWECGSIPTPFVLGLLRPRIYIPFHMTEAERTYILAHERYHIRRGDLWCKSFALLLLTVYWWNPAVWLCWVLFCRDMEMRCDEAVLRELGSEVKQDYSRSLLSFALSRRAPMALAFGEHDAAKRIKNVLNWQQAKPAVVFLAVSAVIMVSLICGTDAAQKKNQITVGYDETGAVTCEVHATDEIHSWALYMDIYDGGRLIQSNYCVLDGFAEENTGVSTRDFTGRLWTDLGYDPGSGFGNQLTWNFTSHGTGSFTDTLPRKHYTGMVKMLGNGKGAPQKYTLPPEGGEVLLYSLLLTTGADGSVTVSAAEKPLTQVNDTVVQYRLVLCDGTMDELPVPVLDLAQELFDLRSKTSEGKSIRALVSALDGDVLPPYFIVTYHQSIGGVIQLDFTEPLDESQEITAWEISCFLLALVDEAQRVDYTFPTPDGSSKLTFYVERDQPDAWARNMGYDDIKEMGASPEGVRDLLTYLRVIHGDTGNPAQRLFALAQRQNGLEFTPELLSANLWDKGPLPYFYVNWPGNFGPSISFRDVPEDPDALDAAVARRAVVLMQLYPQEVGYVMWDYPTPNGDTARREFFRSEAGMILSLSSNSHTSLPVTSAEILEILLRFVNGIDQKLYVSLSKEGNSIQIKEPEPIADVLLGREEAEGLLDHYIPWDFYVDLDAWEDERINEFGGYVYYKDLSRAQFRQFVENLSTVPEELQGVELEGEETDTANITLSGRWTRAELEKIREAIGKSTETDAAAQWSGALYQIMGWPAYVVTEHHEAMHWSQRTYYTIRGGGPMKIAETFGFGEAEDYIVDLDGDGVTELVSNVVFGGDGAHRVCVYQRRGNDVYLGELTPEGLPTELLPNYLSGGAVSWWSEYRPDSGAFRLHYAQKGSEDMGLLETYDLSLLTFSKFSG